MTAIAIFFSTFSSTTLSAILSLGLYIIGHLTADLKNLAEKSESGVTSWIMSALYYLFPNLEALNIKGQAAVGIPVDFGYLLLATLYGMLYAAVLIAGACLVFQRRDF